MTKEFSVIIERDEEGYYIASVPELRGCHTQAKSLDKLMERIRKAIDDDNYARFQKDFLFNYGSEL